MLHHRSLHSEGELAYRPITSFTGISFCGVHLLDETSEGTCMYMYCVLSFTSQHVAISVVFIKGTSKCISQYAVD